jgi:hypothetical protein
MPASNRQFSIALESYLELKDEVPTLPSQPKPASPTINNVLADIGPLPREALFLGVASDGLPVLLNLHDPVPGPMLVTGDSGSGKTALLQAVVSSLLRTHQPTDLQYAVMTNRPDEWNDVEKTHHHVGIFSIDGQGAQDIMLSMATWAHENKFIHQSVLLIEDDLEAMAKLDFDALQNFRWLLARGPSHRVWPIITMDAERYGQVLAWIPLFRTRIFGRIENERVASALGGDKASALNKLNAPNQFSLRENDSWIRFTRRE